jgi:hypothetical protein
MPNDYLRLIDTPTGASVATGAVPESSNPYMATLDRDEEMRRARFRASVGTALDANPDEVARQRRVAQILGRPPAVVEALPEEASRAARMRMLESETMDAPALRRQMIDEGFARVAHDDVESLSKIERGLRAMRTSARSMARFVGDIPAAIYGIGETVTKTAAPLFDPLAGTILPENPVRRMAQGLETMRRQSQRGGDIVQGELPADAGLFERNLYGASRSFGNQLPGLAATLITRNPTYALGSAATLSGGMSATEALDKGASPVRALGLGAADASVEVFFERFGVNQLLKDVAAGSSFGRMLMGQIIREVPSEMATSAVQQFNEQALLHPEKSLGDFIEEMGPIQRDTVIQTVMQTVMTAGLGRGVSYVQNRAARAQEAEAQTTALASLAQVAQASKLAGRDPDSFEAFVRAAAQDGPVTDVYVDAQVLFQLGVAQQITEVSPAVAEQIEAAMQSGGQVRIPIEEFAARIATTEAAGPLLEHLKTEPDGFSRAEATEFMAEQGEILRVEVERQMTEQQADSTFRASQEAVRQRVLTELNAAGRFTSQVNEFNATLIAARTAVRAAQMDMTPEQFFERQMLRVRGEGALGPGVMTQPEGRPGPLQPSDVDVTVDAFEQETGRRVSVRVKADVALKQIDEDEAKAREIMKCLLS